MNDFIYEDFGDFGPDGGTDTDGGTDGDDDDDDGGPDNFAGFEYTPVEKAALVDFMETLTDQNFVSAEKFSDPFVYGTVGINDLDLVQMGIYPNPVVDQATVVLSEVFEGQSTTIRLLDVTGKTIWSDQVNTSNYTFDRGQLAAGTYVLEARSAKHRSSDKLIVK